MFFVDNSYLAFLTVKQFQNRLTVGEVIANSSTPRFLRHGVYKRTQLW